MSRPIHPSGTSTPSSVARRRVGGEALGDHEVDRQPQAGPGARRRPSALARQLDVLGGAQRGADLVALGGEEREAHRAADQDLVGDLLEAFDHGDLVAHLGAAEDRDQRPDGLREQPR